MAAFQEHTMAQQPATISAGKETEVALACRLRHRVGRRGPSPTAGEVEIENVSRDVVEIEVTMHPLQYLRLEITNALGDPVPAAPYGHLFSPREAPTLLRLAPGEKYTHPVSLLGTVAEEKQSAGTYTVQAIYEYNGLRAVSQPLKVQVSANGG